MIQLVVTYASDRCPSFGPAMPDSPDNRAMLTAWGHQIQGDIPGAQWEIRAVE